MCLKPDDFAPNKYYHIYNHAVAGQKLFRDRMDYDNAVKQLNRNCNRDNFELVAYCLMPNHYHILIYQKTEIPVYKFIYKWCNAYSRYFNIRHRSMGTIFSDKLQSICITDEKKLPWLCNQILLNPVNAGLVEKYSDWEWSCCSILSKECSDKQSGNIIRKDGVSEQQYLKDYTNIVSSKTEQKRLLIDA